jgi:hypothetical protein
MRKGPGQARHHELLSASRTVLGGQSLDEQARFRAGVREGNVVDVEVLIGTYGHQVPGVHEPAHLVRRPEAAEVVSPGLRVLPVE